MAHSGHVHSDVTGGPAVGFGGSCATRTPLIGAAASSLPAGGERVTPGDAVEAPAPSSCFLQWPKGGSIVCLAEKSAAARCSAARTSNEERSVLNFFFF